MAAADRDLLFGLLALQNGLIDQVQLVAGFQAWTARQAARPGRPPRRPRRPRRRRSRRRRGHGRAAPPRSTAAPSGAWPRSPPGGRPARASPGSATPRSRPRCPASARRRSSRTTDDERTASYAVGTATADGQRFRVLRPHARGGLGAVFVALDEELHREVALKQILDQHADDPISRARFLLEAEITGGLEHPGIVPVYGLGTYADGRPYYAMRFIRGDSLKEAIDRFHATRPHGRRRPGTATTHGPGRRRWSCASCCGGSSTSATPSTTPTAAASCTATSSRATSSSASTARRWWSTGGWPRRWVESTRARTRASGRWCPPRPAARPRRCRAGAGDARAT